jgi:acetoin utilization deacetylase AcuC-like enzyme
MLFYRHASSRAHDPVSLAPDHPDNPARIEAIEAAMEAADWLGADVREAPSATPEELCLVHTPEHVTAIRELAERGGGLIDAETFVSEGSYHAALHAAGGAAAMVRALLAGEDATGFCALRPSGHHADRDRAMGFCLFNNVAIAAQLALNSGAVGRVFILDWDVHHGNGTAEIFRRRADVLVANIYQKGLYPGTGPLADAGSGEGRGYTINAPLPAGSDEEMWISVLEHVIVPAAEDFAPGLVLISAGFDAHRDDPLGECLLDEGAFAQLACHVRDSARGLMAPLGAVLEGGYDPPSLAASVLATVAALDGAGEAESIAAEQIVTPRLASAVGQFWEL